MSDPPTTNTDYGDADRDQDQLEYSNPAFEDSNPAFGDSNPAFEDSNPAFDYSVSESKCSSSQSLYSSGTKSRRHYACLDAGQMGVPLTSPTNDRSFTEAFAQLNTHNPNSSTSTADRQIGLSGSDRDRDNELMAVDYSAQDFSRNLAAINDAATNGNLYPAGGIKVRHEGDTTVMTEHRDPYSFYWQLDKIRQKAAEQAKLQPPLPPPPIHRYSQQEDNIIEEQTVTDNTHIQSPDSHDSGIQIEQQSPRRLPRAIVERAEDTDNYRHYWHVQALQRDADVQVSESESESEVSEPAMILQEAPPPEPPRPLIIQQQPVIEERAFKQTTTKRQIDNENEQQQDEPIGSKPIRFAVRSLGWTEIVEEELTPERSSRAVNAAIVQLSTGRGDLSDNVAKWGDGRELIMELDEHNLRLIEPDGGTVLHSQAIHHIRVWGVGRDNARDFAYVARDRSSRRFMCHVFRCDSPARTIANTLRDICKRVMLERRGYSTGTGTGTSANGNGRVRHSLSTTHLPSDNSNQMNGINNRAVIREFPAPMDEPSKVIRCHFVGVTQVPRATGIEVLNDAVDRLVAQVRPERWILSDVGIAPSTIIITEVGGNQMAECRVRYLSFLGIGRDIKLCAFIMHTSAENFMCYVFHVQPSAGAMAKTIEAACKLRYQKVLDAHGTHGLSRSGSVGNSLSSVGANNRKGWGDSFRDVFGTLAGRMSTRSATAAYPR